MNRLLTYGTVVVLAFISAGFLLAQSNSQAGTWKLNVAKSKYVNAQAVKNGSRIAWSYTTNYDGKDSATSGAGVPMAADTIASKSVNANTVSSTFKKAGKVVRTSTAVVSKDGKVTTITSKWTNEQGQPASQTTVFDKQ